MSETTTRGIANLATKRRPDPKRMLARNRQDNEAPSSDTLTAEEPAPAQPSAPQPAAADKPKATRAEPSKPLYLQLARKEARLREDQLEALSVQAKRLQRAKGTAAGERITDNTLIRVAVDLLITRFDDLAGVTEEELRNSVIPPRGTR